MRLAKRQAMIDAGEEAYKRRFDQTHHAAELAGRYADLEPGAVTEDEVSVAGRVVAIRDQGKVCFVVLRDGSGDMQLFCRVNVLGEQAWGDLKRLDVGDIVGARGTVLRTRRGELSVSPAEVVLLSKSCRPLPEKFHGLSDKETRYRQRYVDLVVNPEVKDTFAEALQASSPPSAATWRGSTSSRSRRPSCIAVASGANAKPFVTHYNALGGRLLPAHRARAAPQAPARRRLRARVRDEPLLPQRGYGPTSTTPSSPRSRPTRPTPTSRA